MSPDPRTTKASGDQGADIIAIRGGIKLVIQCKLYSSTVGNKAVQEVIAAKGFEKAQMAVVVASNGFTKSAYDLARVTNIALLHHDELAQHLKQL